MRARLDFSFYNYFVSLCEIFTKFKENLTPKLEIKGLLKWFRLFTLIVVVVVVVTMGWDYYFVT